MSSLAGHAHKGGSRLVVAFFTLATLLVPASSLASDDTSFAALGSGHLEQPLTITGLPDVPVGRDGAAVVADGEALYVVGGAGDKGPLGRLERYSFADGRWELLSKDLLPRKHGAAVLVGQKIYIFGGRDEGGTIPDVEVYDLERKRVFEAAPMPTPRYFVSAAHFEGRIFVAGGTVGWGRSSLVEAYDPRTNAWYVAPSLREARDTQLVVSGGELFALGGYTGGKEGVLTVVEQLDGREWRRVSEMPLPTSSFSAAAAGGHIYTFGDHRDPGRVLRFRPADGSWTLLEVGFFPRRHSAAVAVGERVLVLGGTLPGSASKLRTFELFELGAGEAGSL